MSNDNEGIQIRISDLLYAMKKRWKIVLALTICGLIAGMAIMGLSMIRGANRNYKITTSFAVATQMPNGNYLLNNSASSKDDFYVSRDMVDAVGYIIKSDQIIREALDACRLKTVDTELVSQGLKVSQYNETQIMELSFNWSDGDEGIKIVKALLDKTSKMLPKVLQTGNVNVIDEPAFEYRMGGTVSKSTGLILGALGFIAGIGVLILDLLMRPTLLNVGDIDSVFGLETIGVIPNDDALSTIRKSLLVKDSLPTSVVQNYASSAYILMNQLGSKEAHHCFYITSTMDGEGKTMAAANLAIQMSDRGKKVLLIDLDTRNPSLGSLFLGKLDYSHSLNALYRGEVTKDEAITSLSGNLDLLPMILEHRGISIDETLLSFINEMKKDYDYIIIDSAPVGQVSDALSLNQVSDACLFVIRYDFALMQDIHDAIEKLDKSGIRILGTIVNGHISIGASRTEIIPEEPQKPQKSVLEMENEPSEEDEQSTDRDALLELDDEGSVDVYEEPSTRDTLDALISLGLNAEEDEHTEEVGGNDGEKTERTAEATPDE